MCALALCEYPISELLDERISLLVVLWDLGGAIMEMDYIFLAIGCLIIVCYCNFPRHVPRYADGLFV